MTGLEEVPDLSFGRLGALTSIKMNYCESLTNSLAAFLSFRASSRSSSWRSNSSVIQELSASILLFSSSSMTLAVAIYNLCRAERESQHL